MATSDLHGLFKPLTVNVDNLGSEDRLCLLGVARMGSTSTPRYATENRSQSRRRG